MQNNTLLMKEYTKKYVTFKKSFAQSGTRGLQYIDALMKRANNPTLGQDTAVTALFGNDLLDPKAIEIADELAHRNRDIGGLIQRRTALNGITDEHNTAGASGSTGSARTFSAGNSIFQGIKGLDRHGVIKREVPREAFHNGVQWDVSAGDIAHLEMLYYKTRNADGTTQITPVERQNFPISPDAKTSILEFLRDNYPEPSASSSPVPSVSPLDEIARRLELTGESGYSDAEISDLVSVAALNKNKRDTEALWGESAPPEAKELLQKHYLCPHFYLYDFNKAFPNPNDATPAQVTRFRNEIFKLDPLAIGAQAASRRIISVRPGETYAIPNANEEGATQSRYLFSMSAMRPGDPSSHRQLKISRIIPNKITIGPNYGPFERFFNGEQNRKAQIKITDSFKQEASKILSPATQPVVWNPEEALELAGRIYRRSRRMYASEILGNSFGEIGNLLGFSRDVPFNPYDRYITGVGAADPKIGKSSILRAAASILSNRGGRGPTAALSTVFPSVMLPVLRPPIDKSAPFYSWLHREPQNFTEDASATGVLTPKIPRDLSFFDLQSHQSKSDLTDNRTLASSRGSAYTWRQINLTHDLEAGDEHALILDSLRALHQLGYDHRQSDADDGGFGIIHELLNRFRSSSGQSSRHRRPSLIGRASLYTHSGPDFFKRAKCEDLGLDSTENPISAIDMIKNSAAERIAYLNAVQEWQEQHKVGTPEETPSREKSPLPKQQNELYHQLVTLNTDAIKDKGRVPDIGIRIPKSVLDYEKFISHALSVSSLSEKGQKSSKDIMYEKVIYPFLKRSFNLMGITQMTIPGTGIIIPETYAHTSWGGSELEKRRNIDLVFHLAHHIMKAAVGNEICHWCDGTGIVNPDRMGDDPSHYCRHCNVHDPENPRQLLAPELPQDKNDASTQGKIVPVWDPTHMGTYNNGSTASQLTPRLMANILKVGGINGFDEIKALFSHPVVLASVNKFLQNPEKYVPVKASLDRTGEYPVEADAGIIDDDHGSESSTSASATGVPPAVVSTTLRRPVVPDRPVGARPAPTSTPAPEYNIRDHLHDHIL